MFHINALYVMILYCCAL